MKSIKSKKKGVSWFKATDKWRAKITIKGVQIHLGYFDNEQDAINARIASEIENGIEDRQSKSYIDGEIGYIALNEGLFSMVDAIDFEDVNKHKWCLHKSNGIGAYYAIAGKTLMHRHITKAKKGDVIDHIKHNTLDNRRCNLRVGNNSKNMMNRGILSSNKSGYSGVFFVKANRNWNACIQASGRRINLGYFKLKCQAVKARKEAEVKYFGEYNYSH